MAIHKYCGFTRKFFMANNNLTLKFLALSPHIELIIRRIYWNRLFHAFLSKNTFNKYKMRKSHEINKFDFSKIIKYLTELGIKEGDIVIVHSSYFSLSVCGLNPNQIINSLISLVGANGTIVMPVFRIYPEETIENTFLHADITNILFQYDVKKSKVWTGMLPYFLMKKVGSVTSRFPLNTLTAFGPEAKKMFKTELDDEFPTPNGMKSAWNYCADRDAWVISLGTDLTHSLTMIHTAEEIDLEKWPIKNWFRKKNFIIKDEDFEIEKTVLERHPKWGMLNYAERTLCKDLIKNNILTSVDIEGVLIETLKSKSLLNYLNIRNKEVKGYPYYWVRQYCKRK